MELFPKLYFSYSQFFIYDEGLDSPACKWTEAHSRQGFARRQQAIAVGTLLEFGDASVHVQFGDLAPLEEFERVIAIPLEIRSGRVCVDGPEEHPADRSFPVSPGLYRVAIGQKVVEDQHEEVVIALEKLTVPMSNSEILVADRALDPPVPLIEDAERPEP